jgi:hypothetical protein
MGYVMEKKTEKAGQIRITLVLWGGFLMVIAGIYLMKGLATALIVAGLWLFLMGVLADIAKPKPVKQPEKEPKA